MTRIALSVRRSVFWSALLFLGLSITGPVMAQIEEPQYIIIMKDGDFELRDYAPYIVA